MRQFEVSGLELDLVGEALDRDVRIAPITFPVYGRYEDERDGLRARADDALRARGLIERDRLVEPLARAVELYTDGEPSVSVDGAGPHGPLLARAAMKGRDAVFGVYRPDTDVIAFTLGRPEDMVSWALGLLPEHYRAEGPSVTVPRATGRQSGASRDDDEDFSQFSYLEGGPRGGGGYQERERKAARALFNHRELGSGYLCVETAERLGKPGLRLTLDWYDFDVGRYIAYSTFGDGVESRVYAPAHAVFLGNKLHEMIGTCLDALRRR
jgi:hypothetical protein